MKYLVAGTCRNILPYWKEVSTSLQKIFDSLYLYECVIVESNSEDDTFNTVKEWALEQTNVKVISLGKLEGSRTQRIARCRNEYLKYITDHDYLLVVDLDDILKIQDTFKEQLYSCFFSNGWDAIGSNRLGNYYDLWALRCEKLGITYDIIVNNPPIFIKGQFRPLTRSEYFKRYILPFRKNIPVDSEWIECTSAFGGMALYKTSAIRGHTYNGDTTCEHVSFNKGLRMFINPRFISG
jgi:glycosyltransferase involved in cell wall biosynthesis